MTVSKNLNIQRQAAVSAAKFSLLPLAYWFTTGPHQRTSLVRAYTGDPCYLLAPIGLSA